MGESGFDGLGGNSFQDDMEKGLGKRGSNSGGPQGFGNIGGSNFGDADDTGIDKQPPQKKKVGPKNILDEWTEAAGGGWS